MKEVNIYTTPTCAYCHQAKQYFKENNVTYTEYNVADDREKAEEMVNMTGQMGVPVIEIGDELVVGFDKKIVAQLLGLK